MEQNQNARKKKLNKNNVLEIKNNQNFKKLNGVLRKKKIKIIEDWFRRSNI